MTFQVLVHFVKKCVFLMLAFTKSFGKIIFYFQTKKIWFDCFSLTFLVKNYSSVSIQKFLFNSLIYIFYAYKNLAKKIFIALNLIFQSNLFLSLLLFISVFTCYISVLIYFINFLIYLLDKSNKKSKYERYNVIKDIYTNKANRLQYKKRKQRAKVASLLLLLYWEKAIVPIFDLSVVINMHKIGIHRYLKYYVTIKKTRLDLDYRKIKEFPNWLKF